MTDDPGTEWLWGLCAAGFVLLAGVSRIRQREHWIGATVAVVVIWGAVVVLSIDGPELVTGTDPTRIPLVSAGRSSILGMPCAIGVASQPDGPAPSPKGGSM